MRILSSSSAQWQLLVVATAAAACTLTTAALYLALHGFPDAKSSSKQREQQAHPLPSSPPRETIATVVSESTMSTTRSVTVPAERHQTERITMTKVEYLNNADACFDYIVGKDDADEFEDVKVVAKEICAGWEAAEETQISVKIVSGGITNRLFRLTWQDQSVLVRLYGDNTEAFIDRKVENMLFALLSTQGFAPTYYGRFTNGRIEGWMDARPLEPEEMGMTTPVNFLALVGKELGLMHQIQVPLDKSKPVLWAKIDQFERLASEIKFTDSHKLTQLLALDLPQVRADLQWLKSVLPSALNGDGRDLRADLAEEEDEITKQAFAFAHEVVFCHNDALSGNILYNDAWDRVQIIDYEYGGYNFRGFDFANHFCEHCGFEMDLRLYPDPEQQFAFFRGYMEVKTPELLAQLDENKESKAFFHALYPLVNRYALASHLFWGFWAVVQAAHSKIDFDFLDYANKRFTTFRYHRAFFFPPQ